MTATKVERIKAWALANYEKGGSWIIETHTDEEIEESFRNLTEAKQYAKALKSREDECQGW